MDAPSNLVMVTARISPELDRRLSSEARARGVAVGELIASYVLAGARASAQAERDATEAFNLAQAEGAGQPQLAPARRAKPILPKKHGKASPAKGKGAPLR